MSVNIRIFSCVGTSCCGLLSLSFVAALYKLLNPKRSAKSLSTAGVTELLPAERKIPRS